MNPRRRWRLAPASSAAVKCFFHYPQIGSRARKPERLILFVILRLAGGQSAALIVGREPGIAWRLSGPTAQPHTSLRQRPRISKNSAFSAESAFHISGGMERAFGAIPLWLKDLERCPRLVWGRAVGAERLSPTGRFIGSLRRISRGRTSVFFSFGVFGTNGIPSRAVSF